jgi:hypothetical protein
VDLALSFENGVCRKSKEGRLGPAQGPFRFLEAPAVRVIRRSPARPDLRARRAPARNAHNPFIMECAGFAIFFAFKRHHAVHFSSSLWRLWPLLVESLAPSFLFSRSRLLLPVRSSPPFNCAARLLFFDRSKRSSSAPVRRRRRRRINSECLPPLMSLSQVVPRGIRPCCGSKIPKNRWRSTAINWA